MCILLFGCESSESRRDRFFNLGNQALSQADYEQAKMYYEQSLKQDARYVPALNNRGVANMESNHPYEAILDYNSALQIDAQYLDALFNRAYAYEEIGQYEKSLKDVKLIRQLVPDSAFVYFYEGLVQTKIKRYDEALQSFQKSDSLNPVNPETLINIATIFYFKQNYDTANQLVNHVLTLNTGDAANAFNLLSLIALKKKQYQSALAEINRAIDLAPNEPYFINNRGYIYLQMDSLKLAIEEINSSIVLNPENGWAYRNKGIYLLKNKDAKGALELFDRAVKSGEFIDELYTHIGDAHFHLGDKLRACKAWQQGANLQEQESIKKYAQNCN